MKSMEYTKPSSVDSEADSPSGPSWSAVKIFKSSFDALYSSRR